MELIARQQGWLASRAFFAGEMNALLGGRVSSMVGNWPPPTGSEIAEDGARIAAFNPQKTPTPKRDISRRQQGNCETGMLRLLELGDMDQAAVVQRRSRERALPWIKLLHTPEEDRWFFRERVFKVCQLWGYLEDGEVVGFIAFREGWIDHLYVLPTSQHHGIGSALLQVAQGKTHSLNLWTFQRNATARRFYEKHGFALIKETDGTDNEENEPDALYTWRPAT